MNHSNSKTLHNTEATNAQENVRDIKFVGNGDTFQLLCKASSQKEGWMKSTKAMQTPFGCVVQVTTQQKNSDGSYALAEARTFVPRVRIETDAGENGGGRAVPADVHGILLRVASLDDTLKGKLMAWSDTDRRQSKRIKDLGDIARLVEAHPQLWSSLPDTLREQIDRPPVS